VLGGDVDGDLLRIAAIPVVAGVIGLVTNWLAVRMMFEPATFRGIGPIGWQGVIPSKAAKMASISVDKGLAKLGSLSEFYEKLDPDAIARHVVGNSSAEVRRLVNEIAARESPDVWLELPEAVRAAVLDRVETELPQLVEDITYDIGANIDQLMDLKRMVVRHMGDHPTLVNRMFWEVGEDEFRFIIRSGLYFGFGLGLIQMAIFLGWDNPIVLPLAGLVVGFATNWIALQIIFRPIEPVKVGPLTIWGLFPKRQDEVATVYARLVTAEIITLANIVDEMLHGPMSDRTRALLAKGLRPAVDEALGLARPAVRLAVGGHEYDSIRESLATDAVDITLGSFRDPGFNADRSAVLSELIAERMADLTPTEFSELLRSAFEEDEWQLIAAGALLGGLAGLAQMAFVF
jgi:uncharacterized membrane protein YheB (UPF0754 family)